jgi:peptidoglycan/LPS O-acetylase OafA/YrhL
MNRGEIPALTGLRGVAALCVVLGHYASWLIVVPRAEMPAWYWAWSGALPGIGMSIFFTLSGFVIALSYSGWDWRERPGFNLTRLFFYRFARLYPAFALFALLIIFRTASLRDVGDPAVQAYIVPHLLLLQSWLPVKFGGALVSSDAFHVSWSLSAECGLYLLFGLGAVLVAALPIRNPLVLTLAFFISAGAGLWLAWVFRHALMPAGWAEGEWYVWLYGFSPWGVSIQFGMGVLAWYLSRSRLPNSTERAASFIGALGLLSIYGLCATAIVSSHVTQSLVAGAGTALLMAGARSTAGINRWIAAPAMTHIGKVSYSLYLFHFAVPGLGLGGQIATSLDLGTGLYWLLSFALCLAFAVALATGLFHLVEGPGRRAIRRTADRLLGVRPVPYTVPMNAKPQR